MDFTTVWSSPGRKKIHSNICKNFVHFHFHSILSSTALSSIYGHCLCNIIFSLMKFDSLDSFCNQILALSSWVARRLELAGWRRSGPNAILAGFFPCIIKLRVVYASKHFGRFWDGSRFWGDLLDDLVLVVAMVIPFTAPKPGILTKLLFWALFAILIARVD